MRIFVTISHYFSSEGGEHGSMRAGASARSIALRRTIGAVLQHFGDAQGIIHLSDRKVAPANDSPSTVQIAICTMQDRHLLGELGDVAGLVSHIETKADPKRLGFECHAVLRDNLGKYDYYAFMEDDLVIHDPLWFHKLGWFTQIVGNDCLLQPQRYETSLDQPVKKLYIDPDLAPRFTSSYPDVTDRPVLKGSVMGREILFRRTTNPHSGCFFLNAEQMEHWAKQPYFLDRD